MGKMDALMHLDAARLAETAALLEIAERLARLSRRSASAGELLLPTWDATIARLDEIQREATIPDWWLDQPVSVLFEARQQ